MNKRDKAILESLKQFRILTRDQLIKIHFSQNKTPFVVANRVLKRLVDNKVIEVDKSTRPYRYFPLPRSIKKDSMKINHFLAIADFYIDLCKYQKPSVFTVEFKPLNKGGVEPDVFMIWGGYSFLVEIQRSNYTKKQMERKKELYEDYKNSDVWKQHSKYFPSVWLVSERKYDLDFDGIYLAQTRTADELAVKLKISS